MTKEELYAHPGWQWCTAEGAELQVLLPGLRSSFREKLEWLEEAETLTLGLRENREAAKKLGANQMLTFRNSDILKP